MSSSDDYVAILKLTQRYSEAVDAKDWTVLRSCVTEDFVLTVYDGVSAEGAGPAVTRIRELVTPFPTTQHVVSPPLVDITDGVAKGRVQAIVTRVLPGAQGGDVSSIGVRYDDELRHQGDGWKFTRRYATELWTTGNATFFHSLDHPHEGAAR